jgi:hypothetical protein
MTPVSYQELVIDNTYIITQPGDDKYKCFWKGIFRGEYQRYYDTGPNLTFVYCIRTFNSSVTNEGTFSLGYYINRADFHKTDIFYDLEKVKENSKKAIQNMEKRSLDMVLKRLVNEHFEW